MHIGSAIVVAHNSAEYIEECLQALSGESGWEILLIDNASSDGTLARANTYAGRVRIVANDHNLGFAGSVNQALNMTSSSIVVVLNPDAVPEKGALDRLASALTDPTVGAAGGLLLDADGKPQRGFIIRRFPTLTVMVCESLLLNRVWPRNPWNRRYRCLDVDYNQPQVVDQPAGAALAFSRRVWQDVQGFDEQFYPVWFEDVDFCRRIRDSGWNLMYEPAAILRHAGGHSVGLLSFSARQLLWYRNLLRYFRKHYGRWQCLVLRVAIAVGMAIRCAAIIAGIGSASVSRGEGLRAFAFVFRDCVLGIPQQSTPMHQSGVSG